MEEKLGAILANPQLMQQIMSMAQSLGTPPPPPKEPPAPQPRGMDPALVQSILGMVQGAGIDCNQRALLDALCPYLSQDRIRRLERAMRAAKLAGLASGFLGGAGHV